jgi:Protein of unknown function (DUF2911)
MPVSRKQMSHRVLAFASAALIAGSAGIAPRAYGQGYPFSQRGTVSQMIAFTKIAIEYGRPTARGRALFGALVPWDSVWHPGADSATQITITHDITLEDRPVKAGTYTVWLVPHEHAPWTFVLNRTTGIQHTPYPGAASDLLRVEVPVEQLSHVETVQYSFPMVQRDAGQLRLQWGTSAITLHIRAPYRPG